MEDYDFDDENSVYLPDKDYYREQITSYGPTRVYLNDLIYNDNRSVRQRMMYQPHFSSFSKFLTPYGETHNPASGICTHYIRRGYLKPSPQTILAPGLVPAAKVQLTCGTWADMGDNRLLIFGTIEGSLAPWEGTNLKFLRRHQNLGHRNMRDRYHSYGYPIEAITYSNYMGLLASSDRNGNITYCSGVLAEALKTPDAHQGSVNGLSFAPEDTKIASCGEDGIVNIWTIGDDMSKPEKSLIGHTADINCVDWHPYRSLIASAGKDTTIKLWDPKAGVAVSTLTCHKKHIGSCCWNKLNGNWLASGSKDGVIKIFDIRKMKEIEILRGHNSDVGCLGWHPQHESLLLSGGYNGSLIYWLLGQNQAPHTIIADAHRQSVDFLAWHPDGKFVATVSHDGIVKFWSREPPGSKLNYDQVEAIDNPQLYGYGPLQIGSPNLVPLTIQTHTTGSIASSALATTGNINLSLSSMVQRSESNQPQPAAILLSQSNANGMAPPMKRPRE